MLTCRHHSNSDSPGTGGAGKIDARITRGTSSGVHPEIGRYGESGDGRSGWNPVAPVIRKFHAQVSSQSSGRETERGPVLSSTTTIDTSATDVGRRTVDGDSTENESRGNFNTVTGVGVGDDTGGIGTIGNLDRPRGSSGRRGSLVGNDSGSTYTTGQGYRDGELVTGSAGNRIDTALDCYDLGRHSYAP